MAPKTRAGILITGNEIIAGKTKDTNGPFLGGNLRKFGGDVTFALSCGDDLDKLKLCLDFLARQSDVVLMTGGLGPTLDDLTARLLGEFFGIPLKFNEEAWQGCVTYYHSIGRTEIPEVNRKQAILPESATLLPNPNGTAAGFRVSGVYQGKQLSVYAMPGVPAEMEPMFLNHVLPDLITGTQKPVSGCWQVFYLGESAMQERLAELENTLQKQYSDISISYQAHSGYVTYTRTFFPADDKETRKVTEFISGQLHDELTQRLGHHLVIAGEERFPAFLVRELSSKGLKLGLAESCTGGRISAELTAVPGSSHCFAGAVVSYTDPVKRSALNVPDAVLNREGAVSSQAAAFMACGGLQSLCTDICLSATGIAGPEGGNNQNPVGTVYFAMAIQRKRVADLAALTVKLEKFGWALTEAGPDTDSVLFVVRQSFGKRLRRESVQTRATQYALGCLCAAMRYLL